MISQAQCLVQLTSTPDENGLTSPSKRKGPIKKSPVRPRSSSSYISTRHTARVFSPRSAPPLLDPQHPSWAPPLSPAPSYAAATMIISKKNRREICKYLFHEGVLYAKKDYNLAKHPKLDVPNLEVIKLMQSFKSKEYVRETFSWQYYYWYLTNDGIEHLRSFLNLPSEVVPNTLKKSSKPPSRPFGSGPPGDRPRGPPRFGEDRPRFGDRDGYRGAPRGAPGDFEGEKGGAPAEFQPSFRGSRPGFGRGGGGGAFGAGGSSME